MNPADAAALGVADGGLVQAESRWGSALLRARLSEAQRRGSVFAPMHWNSRFSSLPSIDLLVNPDRDPVSGQPEYKHTPVRVRPFTAAWYGFLLSRRRLPMRHARYWSCARGNGYWRYEIAGDQPPGDWAAFARSLLCSAEARVDWLEYFDSARSRYRAARLVGGRLESCIFIGPDPELPARDWLAALFASPALDDDARMNLLTGRPGKGRVDAGRVVCACFNVGENTLLQAIREGRVNSLDSIGAVLGAGSNCGSCIPELRTLLDAHGATANGAAAGEAV